MDPRKSPATVADPALLERVKGIVRRVLAHRAVVKPLSQALREALEGSIILNRVNLVDLAETDAAFGNHGRREGIRWMASGSV